MRTLARQTRREYQDLVQTRTGAASGRRICVVATRRIVTVDGGLAEASAQDLLPLIARLRNTSLEDVCRWRRLRWFSMPQGAPSWGTSTPEPIGPRRRRARRWTRRASAVAGRPPAAAASSAQRASCVASPVAADPRVSPRPASSPAARWSRTHAQSTTSRSDASRTSSSDGRALPPWLRPPAQICAAAVRGTRARRNHSRVARWRVVPRTWSHVARCAVCGGSAPSFVAVTSTAVASSKVRRTAAARRASASGTPQRRTAERAPTRTGTGVDGRAGGVARRRHA